MPRPERGASPDGFREQVLSRLRNRALQEGTSAQRLQQRVAFERLLARLSGDPAWVLKGGFALELRYGWSHRPTRDIDLRFGYEVQLDSLVDTFRTTVATTAVRDGFSFEFGEVVEELQGAPGGSLRVAIVARLAGQIFAQFHLDLSRGDALFGDPEILEGSDLLAFAMIPGVRFPVYPVAQHLAEKLHAYTVPRHQVNTRVKDLVDMVAIAAIDNVVADRLTASIKATFTTRGTHANYLNLQPRGVRRTRGSQATLRRCQRLTSTQRLPWVTSSGIRSLRVPSPVGGGIPPHSSGDSHAAAYRAAPGTPATGSGPSAAAFWRLLQEVQAAPVAQAE